MKIKLSIILITLIFATSVAKAQEVQDKRHEVTFLINNFDNIGIGYRFGTSSALWRVSLTSGLKQTENIVNDTSINNINTESSISIDLGREYRFKVAEDLFVRLGGDLFYSHNILKNENDESAQFRYVNKRLERAFGLKIVSGLMYQPTERIHLGFELLPSFSRIISERTSGTGWDQAPTNFSTISDESFAFNFKNSALRFNIGFNF